MDRRMRQSLDRYITGNYGEDQFKDQQDDPEYLKKEAEFFKKMEMEDEVNAEAEKGKEPVK